jgi:hypothetical protein
MLVELRLGICPVVHTFVLSFGSQGPLRLERQKWAAGLEFSFGDKDLWKSSSARGADLAIGLGVRGRGRQSGWGLRRGSQTGSK